MRRIIVVNAKGGCGKTTIATNLASLYARRGLSTALFDYDPQGSSMCWLEARPPQAPAIHGVAAYARTPGGLTRAWQLRIPPGTQRLIVDTPASLDRPQLLEQLRGADAILIPIAASAIDTRAAAGFLRELVTANKSIRARLAIVANRIRDTGAGLTALEQLLDTVEVPVAARLRDNPDYVQAAEQGLGIGELVSDATLNELHPWQRLLDWLEAAPPVTASNPYHASQLVSA